VDKLSDSHNSDLVGSLLMDSVLKLDGMTDRVTFLYVVKPNDIISDFVFFCPLFVVPGRPSTGTQRLSGLVFF